MTFEENSNKQQRKNLQENVWNQPYKKKKSIID